MSQFIDVEELSKSAGVKLPQQIAQTGYFDINSLPKGEPNTMLSNYSGIVRPIIVLIMIEDGEWKYFDNELISIPKVAELNRSNISYYLSQKLPDYLYTIIGYLPVVELMAKAPQLDMLSQLNLQAELPLENDLTGLSWIQVQSAQDPHPHLYIANLVVSVCHQNRTYTVNGTVYKGPKEIRMSEIKNQQAQDVPILYMPILKKYLL